MAHVAQEGKLEGFLCSERRQKWHNAKMHAQRYASGREAHARPVSPPPTHFPENSASTNLKHRCYKLRHGGPRVRKISRRKCTPEAIRANKLRDRSLVPFFFVIMQRAHAHFKIEAASKNTRCACARAMPRPIHSSVCRTSPARQTRSSSTKSCRHRPRRLFAHPLPTFTTSFFRQRKRRACCRRIITTVMPYKVGRNVATRQRHAAHTAHAVARSIPCLTYKAKPSVRLPRVVFTLRALQRSAMKNGRCEGAGAANIETRSSALKKMAHSRESNIAGRRGTVPASSALYALKVPAGRARYI